MRPVSRLLLIFYCIPVLSVLTSGQVTNTERNKLNMSIVVDYNSCYLWRGYTFSEGSVIQPSASITIRRFSLNFWSNFDLEKTEGSPVFNEFDIILSYTYEKRSLEIQPVVQFYFYPGTVELSTGELTLNTAYRYKNIKFLTSHNIDILNYSGSYYGNAGAGYEKEFYSNMLFECGVSLGWANSRFNKTYGSTGKNALNHICGNLGFTFYPSEYIYTKLRFELSNLLDKDLRKMHTGQPVINWGLTLGMEM